mmetsp:Transcript_89535/g.208532  ORF Transcript_89535/g.208532 Transcript_89535/m.208532 type:complete len:101 (-) Transcript_89535:78-380(-)
MPPSVPGSKAQGQRPACCLLSSAPGGPAQVAEGETRHAPRTVPAPRCLIHRDAARGVQQREVRDGEEQCAEADELNRQLVGQTPGATRMQANRQFTCGHA